MNTVFRPDYFRTFVGFMLVFMIVFFSYSFSYAYFALDLAVKDFLEYAYILMPVWAAKISQGAIICGLGSAVTVYCHKCVVDERGLYGKNTMGNVELAEWDNIESVTELKIPYVPVLRIKLKSGKWSLWVTKKVLENRNFYEKITAMKNI